MDPNNSKLEEIQCTIAGCGKILSSKYNLKRHIESCHIGIRPYVCSICYKKFSSKQYKREHVRLEHSYSINTPTIPRQLINNASSSINIPKLSSMVHVSEDPDIRPLSKVQKIYLYSDLCEKIELSSISSTRQLICTLPSFDSW